jgi:hypothetical protein
VAGTCEYGEGLSGSINAKNFLTSCKVYCLASQGLLHGMCVCVCAFVRVCARAYYASDILLFLLNTCTIYINNYPFLIALLHVSMSAHHPQGLSHYVC